MIIKTILFYLTGYLNIEVEGAFVERFINICKSKNIQLWNIKMKNGIKVFVNIGIKDFKTIRKISKQTKTKIKIVKKCGVPFIMHKYKKRRYLLIIFGISMITIITLSNFIWNINIIGNKNIETEEIKTILADEGLKIGTYKHSLNTKDVINKIRLLRDDIAWIGITISGTNAQVEIKETVKAPVIIKEDEYCNIIADKDGMITKMSVENGTANVKVGDIIRKGDVLVKGYLEGKYTGIRYVHARANIQAKTWYSKKEKVFLRDQIPTDTGNQEHKYSIVINNFKINFYKTLSKFKNYDTIIESKKIRLFSNFYLPIDIIKTTNKEYILKNITYTEEELTRNHNQKNRGRIKDTNSGKYGSC